MRKKATHGPISLHAIAGSHVVLLGMNIARSSATGLLGFAIERTDHTEDERYWLKGFKTFPLPEIDLQPGELVSTLEAPIQSFLWGDFTAKPNHDYTYRIVAMRGKPKKLKQTDKVEVRIQTEDEDTGTHAVWFNRGVAGSQAYARRYHNKHPKDVAHRAAWKWLSRGLEEAMLAFIAKAKSNQYGLRAAVYEFRYAPVLNALKAARKAGADVRIVFDAKKNSQNFPRQDNVDSIAKTGIMELAKPREKNPSYIAHNKFIVLLKKGRRLRCGPVQQIFRKAESLGNPTWATWCATRRWRGSITNTGRNFRKIPRPGICGCIPRLPRLSRRICRRPERPCCSAHNRKATP
jgi:hypothetical protein